jgi:hypothetical protein
LPSPTETARDRAAKIAPILLDWTIGLARFNVLKDSKLRDFLAHEAMLRGRSRGSHKGSGLRLNMKAAEQRASIEWMAKARGALVERCVEAARAVEKSAAFKALTKEFLAIAKAQGNAEAACAAPSEKTIAAAKAAQEKWLPAFIDAIASGVDWANESMDAAERRHGQSAAKKAVGLQALLRIEKAIDALDPQRLSGALDAGDLKTAKAGSAARHRDLFARAVNMGSNWRTSKEINDPNAKDPGPRQRFWAILDLLAPHGLDNAAPAAPGANHPMWRTMLAAGQAATRWAAQRPELTGDGQLQRLVEGWLNIKWSTPWEKIDALGQSAPKNLALEWLNAAPPDTMPLTRQRFLEEDQAEIAAAVEQGRAKAKAAPPESSSAEPPARKRRAGGALESFGIDLLGAVGSTGAPQMQMHFEKSPSFADHSCPPALNRAIAQ